jgi:2-keto-4-pentenoate hydratase/2-oxohepta-3-ene-1,7-dioic acid hydratase in catechol pathway
MLLMLRFNEQDSTTADMIFGVRQTISFLSKGTTLLPVGNDPGVIAYLPALLTASDRQGDLIFTGTPQGVGMGRNPKLWLKDKDVVEVQLEGVGSCVNKVEFATMSSKL